MINDENKPLESKGLDLRKYKVQGKLGSGSFGDVFKVQNIETYEVYAAKISKQKIRKLKNNPDGLLFLFREIKIMSSLNHPSIIRYIGYSPKNFEGLPNPTIITEYAPNCSLRDIINTEKTGLSLAKWNPTKKLIFIYGVASGISYLHHNNVIHRDLKADNILIDEYFHPKISDFGLSKVVNGITQSLRIQSQEGIKGTILYMAPETFDGENYSEFSDVFSFGMIVYEMMNIENYFDGFNQYQVIGQYLKGSRPKIDDIVPNTYRELIERCWSQEPDDRPTFDEILDELKNNQDFITDSVDENEFLDYIEFIDNYQTSFDLANQSFHMNDLIKFQHKKFQRVTIQKDDEEKIINIINENEFNQKVGHFSLTEYNQLSKKCQALVKEAEDNIQAKCSLGINLIEGKNDFPKKFEIGLEYLRESQSKGCKDSIFYLTRMFINGTISISGEYEDEASRILNQIPDKKDPIYFLLSGKIEEKNRNFLKAIKYFKKAIKKNNSEAMFCYGKLLYNGEGVKKDIKKAKKYFKLAQKNGYSFDIDQIEKMDNKEYIMDDKTYNKIFPKDSKGENRALKVTTVGDNIGKQYLLTCMIQGKCPTEYFPTVFENYKAFVQYHEQKVSMLYWDTSGQEEMENIRILSYGYDDIFLMVFRLTNKTSFQNLFSHWIPEVNTVIKRKSEKYNKSPVFILVGIGFEEWLRDPYNTNYVSQNDIDLASKKSYIYKVIKCSYMTFQNMYKLSPSELIDAYIDANYPEVYAKIKTHKKPKYIIENNSIIQACCIGQDQSEIERFLEFIKNGKVDESKISEIGTFVIAHIFEDKDVFLQFSRASFQEAFQSQNNKSKAQCILLVFSLLNKKSFNYLRNEWSDNVNKYPIILVGVGNENWDDNSPDCVNQREIDAFAELIQCLKVIKCSYVTGNQIEYCKRQIIKSVVSGNK